MSESDFSSWSFRTNTPDFESGDTLILFANEYDDKSDTLRANIGDTLITITDGRPDALNHRIKIEITNFDTSRHQGEAKLLDIGNQPDF